MSEGTVFVPTTPVTDGNKSNPADSFKPPADFYVGTEGGDSEDVATSRKDRERGFTRRLRAAREKRDRKATQLRNKSSPKHFCKHTTILESSGSLAVISWTKLSTVTKKDRVYRHPIMRPTNKPGVEAGRAR